jgi:phosphoribosylformimino-5-aminoimidazole carboxamide ribotide isomerase
MLIYPAIDLQAGRCVRLMHGRFDQATVYDDDPFARLAAFAAAGTEWTHVVDLDGARAGEAVQHALVAALATALPVKLQAGGGVRSAADVERLLSAGAARVVVGSAAVQRPQEVQDWLVRFGAERLCLALDVRDGVVAVNGWAEASDVTLAEAFDLYPRGMARHVLITDVSRDGALQGPNLELLREAVALRPDLDIQASGGVASLVDLEAIRAAGAAGAIVGRALYERRFTLEEALDAG